MYVKLSKLQEHGKLFCSVIFLPVCIECWCYKYWVQNYIWSTVNDLPGLLLSNVSNGIPMGGWRNTAREHVLDTSTVHQCLGICQVICIDAVHKVAWLLNTPLIITPPGEWTQQIYLSLRPCSHHWAVLNESVHVWRRTLKKTKWIFFQPTRMPLGLMFEFLKLHIKVSWLCNSALFIGNFFQNS